jgi:hypothetical protein
VIQPKTEGWRRRPPCLPLDFKGPPYYHMIDHSLLMTMLAKQFPEVISAIDEYEAGFLHCEIGVFRSTVEQAMDEGRLWDVERYLRFVDEILPDADVAVQNAIEVSFIEDLALGEHTEARQRAIRDRASKTIRAKMRNINGFWR